MFPAADLFEDIGSFGGPDEGLGMVVVFGEVAVDGDLQVGHTPEDAASDALAGDLGEEAFDEIQPRRRGGREMQTEPGVLREPPLHVRMLVGGVVVDHQMQIEIRRGPLVDHGQKPDEFLVTMTGRAVADDRAVQHVEGGEQCGSAVPLVVVLVWTAPDGIDCARLRLLLTSDKGDRPWNRLAESGWIRRSTFFSFME